MKGLFLGSFTDHLVFLFSLFLIKSDIKKYSLLKLNCTQKKEKISLSLIEHLINGIVYKYMTIFLVTAFETRHLILCFLP
jgi:hypothetical protein